MLSHNNSIHNRGGSQSCSFSKRSVSRFGRVLTSARGSSDSDISLKTGKFTSTFGKKKLLFLERIDKEEDQIMVRSPLKDQSERRSVNGLISAMEEFRKLDPDMQISTALTFLYTATTQEKENGVSVKEVGEMLGATSSTASRNVALMCHYGGKGHGLLVANEDMTARNRKMLEVTPKGVRVLQTITKFVKGAE